MKTASEGKPVKKTNRLAITSAIFGTLAIPAAFFTGDPLGIGPIMSGLYVVLVPLSVILGIVALIQIIPLGRNRQGGIFLAILGIIAGLFSMFCFFIHFTKTFNY